MNEIVDNTFTAYYGPEFQQRLMWQILVEPEFAEKTIPDLSVEYFDDPNLRRLFLIILEFVREFEKVPNLQNQSIYQAINKYKTPNNVIEEESLFGVLKRIELWNERVLNKQLLHDGDIVQKETVNFIKQQEYRKLGEFILDKTKNGEIKSKYTISAIEDKIQKISHIGDDEDYGVDVVDNIERALRKEFRQTIPTGVEVLDAVTGGGLGKGEIGLILTPSGVGKTTLLTKIANTAREMDYNVLQIIFEDTVEQIQRKHCTIWTGVPLSQINDEDKNEYVLQKTNEKIHSLGNKGRLIIKKFSQEDTTMRDIRNFITRYEKKWGFKFDIVVLDYLDCLDSHKRTNDRNEAELVIIKSFEAMAGDLNIPCWSAIQSNRSGFDAELVEAHQSGGNIKRIQKAHFFMSVAKTPDQKEAHLANIRIIKARFAQDGQTFKDCIFNNDTMQITIQDERYGKFSITNQKKYDNNDIERIEKKANSVLLHGKISNAVPLTLSEEQAQLNSLRESYLKQNNSEKVTNDIEIDNIKTDDIKFHEQQVLNDGINDGVNNNINDTELFIIDGEIENINNCDTENDAINDTVNDGVKQYGIDVIEEMRKLTEIKSSFEWTGETFTNLSEIEPKEVKLDDINLEPPIIIEQNVLEYNKIDKHNNKLIKSENLLSNNKILDAEKILMEDPDESVSEHKSVFEILEKARKSQNVIKKE